MIEPARQYQHYEVLRREDGQPWELGRGAMGVTYKAFDVNLCVEVALKVVSAALLDHPEARERFVREARAAAALRHRNVASVYHLGNEGDRFFYAMEFIDGETLDALVRRAGPLGPRAVLDVLLQVARALGAAARQGLVHRDIKPANLMAVHEDADEQRVIKVIDFGLARPVAGEEGASQLTVGGGFLGTPQYASPEQLEEKPLDARSDIYSLGVVAWFLLAGRAPFAGSLATICQGHTAQPPPWDALPISTPAPLRELLARMLAKDPAQRHQDAAELGHAIKACLQAVPATGAEDLAWDRGTQQANGTSPPSLEPVPGSAPADLTGTVLAGRYEVVQLAAEDPDHRLYQARDRWDGQRAVAVRTFARGLTDTPEKLARLEDEVRLARAAQQPGLVRLDALEQPPAPQPVFLVEEWVDGFTLRDLLAARGGTLAAPDALRLLEPAAQAADPAANCRLEGLGLGLHQVRVHFPSSELGAQGIYTARTLLPISLAEWPEGWTVKIHPLTLRPDGAELDTWAGGVTLVPGSPAPATGGDVPLTVRYRQELAGLVYELLGGQPTQARVAGWSGDYSALPALSETANRVLRQAMSAEDRPSSSQEFCHELRAAAGLEAAAPPRPLPIPLPPVPAAHVLPVRRVAPTTGGSARRMPSITRAALPATRTFLPPDPTPGLADDAPPDGSAWERLNIGADDGPRPGRWLAALVTAGIVFAAAFAGVLAVLLYRGSSRDAQADAAKKRAAAVSPAAQATPPPKRLTAATPAREATPPPLPREKPTPSLPAPRPDRVTVVPVAPTPRPLPPSASPSPALPVPPVAEDIVVTLDSKPSHVAVGLKRGSQEGEEPLGTTPMQVRLPPGDYQLITRNAAGSEARAFLNLKPGQRTARQTIYVMGERFDPLNPASGTPVERRTPQPFAPHAPPSVRPAATATPVPVARALPVEREPVPAEPEVRRAVPVEETPRPILTPFLTPAPDGPPTAPAVPAASADPAPASPDPAAPHD